MFEHYINNLIWYDFAPPKSQNPYTRGHKIYNFVKGFYCLPYHAVIVYSVPVKLKKKIMSQNHYPGGIKFRTNVVDFIVFLNICMKSVSADFIMNFHLSAFFHFCPAGMALVEQ